MNRIYYCSVCKEYTFKKKCCEQETIDPRPGKFRFNYYPKQRLEYKKLL